MRELLNLDYITFKILPLGCDFFPQQKEAILADGSIDIVAGPGSGKTTVLIAKYGLLLNEVVKKNEGVCLITHTNVAVEEVRTGLMNIGINDIEYPHFIGTIQEFFNSFFSRKAFHLLLGDKKFRVLDDDEYQERFEQLFNQRKPKWYRTDPPKFSNKSPKLNIYNSLEYDISSNTKDSYKEVYNGSIKTLFSRGILTNHQCLELSYWYINKYGVQIERAILNRFKYVLLDEAQDTSHLQFQMLNLLFSNENVSYQKFGDPYQALYNIFEGNEDAWSPTKQDNPNYREIAETSRFGSEIADIVKYVCVEKYDGFNSLNIVNSFKPHFIVYKNDKDMVEKYKKLIEFYESESEHYKNSRKKDAILSPFHNNLAELFPFYVKPSSKFEVNQSLINRGSNFLINLLSQENGIPFKDTKSIIDNNLYIKELISKCIKEIMNKRFDFSNFQFLLNKVLSNITSGAMQEFSRVELENESHSFRQTIFSNADYPSEEASKASEFYIGTVHSAKGETHRSTLFIIDTIFYNYQTETHLSMFDLLIEYLSGNYVDPNEIKDENIKKETIKSLKLAYVALSRPTHLMAIAIPENRIGEDGILSTLEENGWKNADNVI